MGYIRCQAICNQRVRKATKPDVNHRPPDGYCAVNWQPMTTCLYRCLKMTWRQKRQSTMRLLCQHWHWRRYISYIYTPEWKYDIISKRFKVPVATLCYTYIWSENIIYLYTIGSKSLRRCYVSNIYERVKICIYDIQICVTAASLCFMHI